MPIEIGAIILNTAISQVVGGLLSNFFNLHGNNGGKTLQNFLDILSSDFTNRVERVVRDAFNDQNFVELKTNVTAAATALRTYAVTERQDELQLTMAYTHILAARSRLFTVGNELIKYGATRDNFIIADPVEKGRRAVQHHRSLEALIHAIQAIAALDLLILSTKAEQIPPLKKEIVTRIDEYNEFTKRTINAYKGVQFLRRWIHWNHSRSFECGYYCFWAQGTIYKDGVVQTQEKKMRDWLRDEEQIDLFKREFESNLAHILMKDKTLDIAAEKKIKESPGNITEAQATWAEVRKVFA